MTVAGSFPGSDPPFWKSGVPSSQTEFDGHKSVCSASHALLRLTSSSATGRRLGGIRLANIGEAIAMMALLPFAILVAGATVIA